MFVCIIEVIGEKMKFCVLASGSKGNMTYIESSSSKILIDAGISYKEASLRSNIDFTNLDAILITHEHSDHICGLITMAKKTNAPIYVHEDTYNVIKSRYKEKLVGLKVSIIEANKKYQIKDLRFLTLRLSHDSACCLGFIFVDDKNSLGYITDTGFLPIPYIDLLKKVDALIIEANHDVEMLHNSNRPWMLKERILSIEGHMSNYISGQIIKTVLSAHKLKMLVLAHLSEECNTEEIAIDTILSTIEGDYLPKIMVAHQHQATPIIEV
jgi:phosphoribosyl 1,2-cyclic phosphodiesterase